jgi:hypothetical protein
MANKTPSPATRFKKGETGNPGGKPVGTRDRITTSFLYELAADFEKHGQEAIVRTREEDPATYIKICAALVPRELNVEVKHSFVDILRHLEAERRERQQGAVAGEAGDTDEPVRH